MGAALKRATKREAKRQAIDSLIMARGIEAHGAKMYRKSLANKWTNRESRNVTGFWKASEAKL